MVVARFVDADLADYFGSITHAELMLSLTRRILDRRVLHLIKMWLECAVEEPAPEQRFVGETNLTRRFHKSHAPSFGGFAATRGFLPDVC